MISVGGTFSVRFVRLDNPNHKVDVNIEAQTGFDALKKAWAKFIEVEKVAFPFDELEVHKWHIISIWLVEKLG